MTTPTSGAADLPEALRRVIDEFERRERGIPQAHIAAALVTELRAALAAGQTAVSAIDASPSAASIAWNALRDATDPLGELGARIMGHVRIFAQRQYEAGRDEVRPAPPAMDGGEDARLFPAMSPELSKILGTMCFQCITFAQALRAAGHQIETRAEAEQAAVLHWMLGHYFRSGEDGWREAAADDMKRMAAEAAARAAHIEKLQAKLTKTPSFAPQRVREG